MAFLEFTNGNSFDYYQIRAISHNKWSIPIKYPHNPKIATDQNKNLFFKQSTPVKKNVSYFFLNESTSRQFYKKIFSSFRSSEKNSITLIIVVLFQSLYLPLLLLSKCSIAPAYAAVHSQKIRSWTLSKHQSAKHRTCAMRLSKALFGYI